jgi:uncharacterized membrane protein YfcA
VPDWFWPEIPSHVSPWLYYLCVGAAVMITGISKGGFGGGTGILAIPLMAIVMGPHHMLGVMLPLLIACDIFSNVHYQGHRDWVRLRPLLIGAFIGVAGGGAILYALGTLPPASISRTMNTVVGSVCLAVVAMQVLNLMGYKIPTLPRHPISGGVVGFFAAALSTVNHGAGPIVTIYFLQEKLPKKLHVGSTLIYFVIINSVKVIPYVLLANDQGRPFINSSTLKDSIWFIPLIPISTLIGVWMHNRVSEKPFAVIMYVSTAIAAGYLLGKSLGWI